MINHIVTIATLTFIVATPASGQPQLAPKTDTSKSAPSICADIADSAKRLTCYDNQSARKPVVRKRAADGSTLEKAKAAVAKKLKDPYSARFEDLRLGSAPNVKGEPTERVCGFVNAKNSYGAYGGRTPFVYFPKDDSAQLVDDSPEGQTWAIVYRRFCA